MKTSTALRRAALGKRPSEYTSMYRWLDGAFSFRLQWAVLGRDWKIWYSRDTDNVDRAMYLLFLSHYFKDLGE